MEAREKWKSIPRRAWVMTRRKYPCGKVKGEN